MPRSNFCEECHRKHLYKFTWKRIITVKRAAFWNFHFQNRNFEKRKEWSGDMVNSYLFHTIGVNSLDDFWEKMVLWTDGLRHKGQRQKFSWKRIISVEEAALWNSYSRKSGKCKKKQKMTPKWPWTLQGQRYPKYVLLLPRGPTFTPFCSTTAMFRDNWSQLWFPP